MLHLMPVFGQTHGMCYEEGSGVERDTTKAVEWYDRAADLGDVHAQYRLGWCLNHGVGVERDRAKAIEWYTAAAGQGDADTTDRLHMLGGR